MREGLMGITCMAEKDTVIEENEWRWGDTGRCWEEKVRKGEREIMLQR